MSGSARVEEMFNMNDEMGRREAERAQRESEEIRKRMSPAGSLGLPPLLDARRLDYGLIDEAFSVQPAFDRVHIMQVFEVKKYGDTSLFVPERAGQRQQESMARGLLIGAGLRALDNLRSNGIDLGHIVTFINNAPFRYFYGWLGGKQLHYLLMRDGDICGSEDLASNVRSGSMKVELCDDCHVFRDENGNIWKPKDPWMGADF